MQGYRARHEASNEEGSRTVSSVLLFRKGHALSHAAACKTFLPHVKQAAGCPSRHYSTPLHSALLMPLRASLQSLNEREAIEREWETERSFPLANLSTQRRSALRFVPATKTDEEWTRATRAGLDASFVNEQSRKLKSSQQIAADNAQWYRELVGSRSATPKATIDPVTSTASVSGPATGSRVTLEKLQELDERDRLQLDGQGTRDVPFTLSDDDEDELAGNETSRQERPATRHLEKDAEQDNAQSVEAGRISKASSIPSSTEPPLAGQETPPVCPPVPHVQPAGSVNTAQQPTDISVITIDDTESEEAESRPEDMFCVLCKVLVPASDVPTHLTTILHQLSRHPSNSVATPLIPPTHYHLRANTNIGYGMLERLGWQPEQGLGSAPETGRKVPIRVVEKFDKKGVGADIKKRAWDGDIVGEGKPKLDNQMVRKRAGAAKPLARNRKELEKAKKGEMQMFKAGLAYLNS